jgi:hypothetical protein
LLIIICVGWVSGNRARASQGGSAKYSDDDDDDEEELPDMDDEAMFRLDGVMAAQLRGLADAKAARKAEAEAALNFKLRVAGLMEAYIKRVPGGEILPEAGLHLYRYGGVSASGRLLNRFFVFFFIAHFCFSKKCMTVG